MNQSSEIKQEIIINCPIHNYPIAGICGDKNCTNGSLICYKCNEEPCIISKKHELISLDEFHTAFFNKTPGLYDFNKVEDLKTKLKKIDLKNLSFLLEKYTNFSQSLIESKLNQLEKNVLSKVQTLKANVHLKLETLQKEYMEAENRIDLSSFEIPENFTLEETKKFFEKNSKSIRDMENMINLVKKYSDNEKLAMNQKDMETIIYSKNLTDLNSRDILDEKFNGILKETKEGLTDILKNVIIEKENTIIFFSGLKKFTSNPKELKYKQDLTDKCQKSYTIDSVFTAFTSVDGNNYVAWATPNFMVEVYDLKTNSVIKQLTGHTQHVYIVRHFLNKKTSTDYLISTSYERNCKVWSVKTFTCLITISNCHTGYYLYSSLILFDDFNNKSYILTTAPNEFTKVWDFSGNHVKDIASTSDYTYYIGTWYDLKNQNIYIINANSADVKLYDFKTGSLFKAFKSDSTTWHMSALVQDIKDVPHLFETDGNGYLRIWNIQTGLISKTMQAVGCNLRGLSLWNDQYVITASSDKSFKIFDYEQGTLIATISGHDNVLCTVEKIIHPVHGESLLTSAIDGKIKLWTSK